MAGTGIPNVGMWIRNVGTAGMFSLAIAWEYFHFRKIEVDPEVLPSSDATVKPTKYVGPDKRPRSMWEEHRVKREIAFAAKIEEEVKNTIIPTRTTKWDRPFLNEKV